MILMPPFAELYSVARPSLRHVIDAQGQLVEVPNDTLGLTRDPATLQPRGLLIEPQRTNAIRNPRGEGGTIGASSFPTYWSHVVSPSGLTRTLEGRSVEAGIPLVRLRWAGTPTNASGLAFAFDTNTAVPVSPGQVVAFSFWARLVSGEPNLPQIRMFVRDASGSGQISSQNTQIPLDGVLRRHVLIYTVPNLPEAAFLSPCFGFGPVLGTPYDVVVDIGAAQLEVGETATSIILPPAGSPGTATRLADAVSVADLALIGFRPEGHTFLIRGRLDAMPPAGSFTSLFRLQDAAGANMLSCHVAADGRVNWRSVIDGTTTELYAPAGSIAAGADFSVAATFGAGVQRLSVGGGLAVEAQPPGLPAGLSRLLLGSAGSGTSNVLGGTLALFESAPGTLSLADIQALAAAA